MKTHLHRKKWRETKPSLRLAILSASLNSTNNKGFWMFAMEIIVHSSMNVLKYHLTTEYMYYSCVLAMLLLKPTSASSCFETITNEKITTKKCIYWILLIIQWIRSLDSKSPSFKSNKVWCSLVRHSVENKFSFRSFTCVEYVLLYSCQFYSS